MKRLTIILLFFASVLQGQTGAGYWYGSTEPGTITPEPDTLTLTYWDDFVLLHIQNTGITEDANGVSQWQDRSGNGNHSTQSVNANKPSTDGSGNVVFDGTQYLTQSTFFNSSADTSVSIFVAYCPTQYKLNSTAIWLENRIGGLYTQGDKLFSIRIDSVSATTVSLSTRVRDSLDTGINWTKVVDTISLNSCVLHSIRASNTSDSYTKINGIEKDTLINRTGHWAGVDVGVNILNIGAGFENSTSYIGKILFIGIAN